MLATRTILASLAAVGVYALPQAAEPASSVVPSTTLATLSNPKGASPELKRLGTLLPKVLENAISITKKSWEYGALTQALLEVYDPQYTPFAWDPEAIKDRPLDASWRFLSVTNSSLADYGWTGSPGDMNGWYEKRGEEYEWLDEYLDASSAKGQSTLPRALINGDGALGDPCSLGPAVWLVSYLASCRDEVRDAGLRDAQDYAWAVGNQLKYLNNGVRSDNNTISQREVEKFVAWSDMGYMIPPFLAYIGMATESAPLLGYGLDQWRLESSSLLRDSNLYAHITAIDPTYTWDDKIWATGNGWMTYGLVRVLASIQATKKRDAFIGQVEPFHDELVKVFDALLSKLDSLIPNNMELAEPDDKLTKGDSAATALVVAAFYRFAVLAPDRVSEKQFEKAEQAFNGVLDKEILGDDGWLRQVVDPWGDGWVVKDDVQSPEGQSFLGMLWAARVAYEHSKTDPAT